MNLLLDLVIKMRWLLALAVLACARAATAPSFAIVNDRFQKDGASFQIISGRCALPSKPSKSSSALAANNTREPVLKGCVRRSIHYFRIHPSQWCACRLLL